MLVVRALGRPMLASIFIVQGYDTFRHPERVAAKAEPVVRPVAERVSVVPAKTEQAVRLNGAVQMAAGSLLALGRFPRLSALAIAGTLVPTTLAGHRFWEAEDEASKTQQRIHFLKNLSMFGGLVIAAVDTGGKPSLLWRARYAVKSAGKSAGKSADSARRSAVSARRSAERATESARRSAIAPAKAARRTAKAARLGAKAARPVQSTQGAARLARREAALTRRTAKTSGKAGAKASILAGRTAKTSGKAGLKARRVARRVSR
jgi:putative oxidoreductase